jgi:hypothetical protein
MYTEYQEHFVYGIIWILFVMVLLTTGSVIFNNGTQNTNASIILIVVNLLMGYGMYKYKLWFRKYKRRR